MACQYVFWNNPTPVVAAIVEYENKVVLARHRGWPLGLFGLISGFLEEGETPEAGILREVNEELSLEGSIVKTIGHYSFPEMNQLIIAFYILARGKLSMNEELVEIKHVRPDKLIPWSLGAGPAVKDWLEARID